MKKTLLTIAATVAIGVGLAQPADALIPYSIGVKDINIAPTTDACVGGQALPCTTGAGTGNANVVRITQQLNNSTDAVEFSGFSTTADDGDDLWMAARIGAECRSGHRLQSAAVKPHYRYDAYREDVSEVQAGWTGASVSVPHALFMPDKTVALNIPVAEAFASTDGFTLDFETMADVYEAGEDRIDQRMAAGMTEDEARAIPFSIDTWLEMHADVRCATLSGGRVYVKRMPVYLPLELEFLASPVQVPAPVLPPARDQAHGGGFRIPEGVTSASLNVIVDPVDSCTLHLSGSITASVATEVHYRFIDEYGQRSNGFSIDVADDQAEFFVHDIDLSPGLSHGGPGLTTGGGSHEIGGYSVENTDRETGTYQLEVFSPNLLLSNIDGFNVPACS